MSYKDYWGKSNKWIDSKWEYADLSLDVVAGEIKVRIGELSIPIDELDEFIEWVKSAYTLLDSVESHIPSKTGGIDALPIIKAEMEKLAPKIRSLFKREDIFYKILRKK